jgi:hypothetical protein
MRGQYLVCVSPSTSGVFIFFSLLFNFVSYYILVVFLCFFIGSFLLLRQQLNMHALPLAAL